MKISEVLRLCKTRKEGLKETLKRLKSNNDEELERRHRKHLCEDVKDYVSHIYLELIN